MKFNLSVKTPEGTVLIPLEAITEENVTGNKIIAYTSGAKYSNMLKRIIAGEKVNVDSTQRKERRDLTKMQEDILSNCMDDSTILSEGKGEGKGKSLKCKYCGEKFDDEKKLNKHQKKCADAKMNY